MALCVQLNTDGTITPTGQPISECTGYVMVSGSEYGVYQLMQDVLATPTHEEMAAFSSLGFFGVLALYMVGRMWGSVANFFDR